MSFLPTPPEGGWQEPVLLKAGPDERGGFRLSVGLPEENAKVLLACFREFLDQHGEAEAPNYVEMQLVDKDTRQRYTVTVGRPGGKTPHELRVDAEAALKALVEWAGEDFEDKVYDERLADVIRQARAVVG